MSYDDEEKVDGGFKMSDDDTDLPEDEMPDLDFGLDEEDPDKDN